jgi:hypothetical protein
VCFNDVAGVYGSLVYGISNSIAESTGVIVPYIVAELTKNVFLKLIRCYFSILLFYTILANTC